jgi:hypothetical protein
MRGVWLIPFAVLAASAELGDLCWGGRDGAAAGVGLVLLLGMVACLILGLLERCILSDGAIRKR